MKLPTMLLCLGLVASFALAAEEPGWREAWRQGPLSAEETRAFMERLARYVFDHHLKKAPDSPQRGMVYEYFDVAREGKFDQWVQGEGLDTMHDGAWFAAAMVNATRATGEPFYKDFLTQWILPFYLKMLNHSDELFTTRGAVAREGAAPWGKPWAYQEGEKGFIPYWWDDGASVSLERRRTGDPLPIRPSHDNLHGKPNPKALLDGYSLGMSNHMAQDIGVMLQLAWLLLRDSGQEADQKLAAQVAQAARNLHESRMRHHGPIPMCVAPAAVANRDPQLMQRVPRPRGESYWTAGRHYLQALRDYQPDQRTSAPGFADDQQYRYYYGIARTGGQLTDALAFKTIADAYTEPMLFRAYCDDWEVPPGINKFDLYPLYFVNGKPLHYRSERKGPGGRPIPIGSRFGPQNMVCCGWALQALKATPGIWERPRRRDFPDDLRVTILDPVGGQEASAGVAKAAVGGIEFQLTSTREKLILEAKLPAEQARFRIWSRPDAEGRHAAISVEGRTVSAANQASRPLVLVEPAARKGPVVRIPLPYTFVKGQKPWASGVEHGRYAIQAGEGARNFVLASPEPQVKAWLERELGCGLRTWKAIFEAKGYIPTGMGTGRHWDRFSDTGGYAHLISAAAQWLLYLEGKRDWELHNVPRVLDEERTK
ncbi:MAG: hypothetical protein ACLF0G_11780 [Candidatus Brocadiia bacterium]